MNTDEFIKARYDLAMDSLRADNLERCAFVVDFWLDEYEDDALELLISLIECPNAQLEDKVKELRKQIRTSFEMSYCTMYSDDERLQND